LGSDAGAGCFPSAFGLGLRFNGDFHGFT
jgi:hypothetical protein